MAKVSRFSGRNVSREDLISWDDNLDSLLLIVLILDVGCILEASANPNSLSTHGGASFPESRVGAAVVLWFEDKGGISRSDLLGHVSLW